MALSKGVNSYVTVEEADLYFADKLDVAAWVEADATLKAQALITATSMLDLMSWTGSAVYEDQDLAFPRTGEYFDPKIGSLVVLEETVVPNRIIKANLELAYHLLNNDGLLDSSGTVKNLEVGSIKLEFINNPNKLSNSVRSLTRPLLVNAGSKTWWRAN